MWVQRNLSGSIIGAFSNRQPGYAEEELSDNDPVLLAFLKPMTTLPIRDHTVFLDEVGLKGDYFSNPTGFTDNAPLWEAAMAAAPNGGKGLTWVLPNGYFAFSRPIAMPPAGYSKLVGQPGATFIKNWQTNPSQIFLTAPIETFECRDVAFHQSKTGLGGIGIGRRATDSSNAPMNHTYSNLTFSTQGDSVNNVWNGGIIIDGIAGLQHFGARRHHFERIIVQSISQDGGSFGVGLFGVNLATGDIAMTSGPQGLWIFGTPTQPSNIICLNMPMGNLQIEGGNNVMINAAALNNCIIDGNSAACSVNCPQITGTFTMSSGRGNRLNGVLA